MQNMEAKFLSSDRLPISVMARVLLVIRRIIIGWHKSSSYLCWRHVGRLIMAIIIRPLKNMKYGIEALTKLMHQLNFVKRGMTDLMNPVRTPIGLKRCNIFVGWLKGKNPNVPFRRPVDSHAPLLSFLECYLPSSMDYRMRHWTPRIPVSAFSGVEDDAAVVMAWSPRGPWMIREAILSDYGRPSKK